MTALPNWDIAGPTDAELAEASAGGDRRAFAQIYDRYADRLHDFCVGMLTQRDDAADCVQEAFCIAAHRMTQLREPDKLRPWLYSIARNECLRRIRERTKETPSYDVPEAASGDPGPDTMALRHELADLLADAAGGLSDRDRAVLELAFRHGLSGPDLAEALGVSHSNANTIVHRMRETIERSLGALLVARRVRGTAGCPELAELLQGWDGHFTVLMRKRVSRHIESCDVCESERRRLVSPAALLGGAPVLIPAPRWLRDRTLGGIQLASAAQSYHSGQSETAGNHPASTRARDGRSTEDETADAAAAAADAPSGDRERRRMIVPVSLFAAALITALAVTLVWLNRPDVAIMPTHVTGSQPSGSSPPPGPSLMPPPPAATTPAAPPSAARPSSTARRSSPRPPIVQPAPKPAPTGQPAPKPAVTGHPAPTPAVTVPMVPDEPAPASPAVPAAPVPPIPAPLPSTREPTWVPSLPALPSPAAPRISAPPVVIPAPHRPVSPAQTGPTGLIPPIVLFTPTLTAPPR